MASNGLNHLVTILVQIASVPIYLKAFESEIYGEWLVLSAIPMYLSLGDMGFASVGTTQATQEFAVGAISNARRTMRTSWVFVSCLSLSILVLTASLLPALPIERLPIHAISNRDACLILLMLLAYMFMGLQASLVEGCFRAGERFPVGTVYSSVLRLSEFVIGAAISLWTHDPVALAAALVAARVVGQVCYIFLLWKLLPQLSLGFRGADLAQLRGMIVPGLSYLSLPLGNAFMVQGMIMATAAKLGAEAVVTLTALRMMVNLVTRAADVTNHAVLPEITASMARGEAYRARLLVSASLSASLAIGGACCIFFYTFGDQVLKIWTDGAVVVSTSLMLAMSATVLADLPWRSWSLPVFACNQHHLFCVLYAGSCLLAVVVAWLILPRFGLLAVPLALFITDLALYSPTYRGAKRVLSLAASTPAQVASNQAIASSWKGV